MAASTLLRVCLLPLLLVLLTPALPVRGLGFHSNVHLPGRDGETGGFRLYSLGQLHDVLFLDSHPDFSVRVGSDGRLRVQPLTSDYLNATWWLGRPLLGRKVPQLSSNGSVTERSLLKKVKAIHPQDTGLLRIELVPVSLTDFIKSGVIQVQFSPHDLPLPAAAQEHPGSVRDLLQGSEGTVTLDPDSVSLMTSSGGDAAAAAAATRVVSGRAAEHVLSSQASPPELLVKLNHLRETQRLHPSLQMTNDGTAKECYTTRMTVEVTLTGIVEVTAGGEVGVDERHLVSSSPKRHLHRVPLVLSSSSSSSSSPHLHLVTSYSSTTWLHVYVTTSGPLHFSGGYNATGNVIIESSVCNGGLPRSTLNFTGWSAVASPWSGQSHAHFRLQVALSHEVRYESSLQWEGISEPVKSLPALVLSVTPTVTMRSSLTPDSSCLHADLSLDGRLHLEDPDRHRGGAVLAGGRGLSGTAWAGRLFHQCSALCPEDTPTSSGVSMATLCGRPSSRITRDDPRFQRLQVVQEEGVEFRGEEGAASAWCGAPGQPCPPCLPPSPQTPPCADRVMSPDAARLLSRLANLARLQWGASRRVVVEEAWDEPDELHPFGRHGNQSLHYEGRALLLSLGPEAKAEELRRLAQLAVCAGFPYADVTSSSVAVCTAASQSEESTRHRRSVTSSPSIHKIRFQKFMQSIDGASLPTTPDLLTPLAVGESHPPGRTPAQVLGPPLSDPGVRPEELFQYTYPDVDFPPEGPASSSCQQPPRPCQSSCQPSESANSWDWCRHRAMTPRAALRLRRLAVLVQRRATGVKIVVAADAGSQNGIESGRTLRITLPKGSRLDGGQLSSLALQAGFDYVTRTSQTSLQVYVKRQEGYRARLVPYQSTSLLAVQSPAADYDLPPTSNMAAAEEEEEEVPLVDGHDRSLPLSAHFRVGDFAHPDHRFFRLQPLLLACLELATQELGAPPRVEAGYRPLPVHRLNLASRPRQERGGFPQGRAVFLQPPASGDGGQEQLRKVATAVLGRCTPPLLRLHRKLGLGCHGDKLYVDVRARTSGDVDQGRYAEVWDVDNPELYAKLTRAQDQMSRGGPVIAPTSEARACKVPLLGEKLAYFSFSISPLCLGLGNPCGNEAHLRRRKEVAAKMVTDLNTVLAQVVPHSTVSEAVTECLVTHCGGCLGAGKFWKRKVEACVKLVKLFSEHAPSPWGASGGRARGASFLNSHAPQSSLHGLACQEGGLCLENTQLYSFALPALQARYRPDPDESREELLYSGEDNASPLLEVIQQEMARNVQGRVKVYIEREGDLGVLKDTLKVLMVHNPEVTEVEFHFLDEGLRDRMLPRLQRHLEGWALRACPRWSRFAVAPFSLHVIPPSRQKRSAELSRDRNQARQSLHSWETDWLLRI